MWARMASSIDNLTPGMFFAQAGAGGQKSLEPTFNSLRSLQLAAKLLGCDTPRFSYVLCYRQIRSGREWLDTPNTAAQALELCDSLTKASRAA